ncbi:MAG TPA: Asp-tRNA(Asn)/Glu-tRNA(Gln) amidotransferase subunit GatC [Candidatus Dormibacteraeota bacterium]|jgi:aspartyl-tRNA(Asn)/glutamyl-tRNA(Gln) amidotransferase subunit C|nr:Asp-tRNA(Asn)/Glu-tRNA(Gln) amidotransferase subunit GatC [Candidatus Dormibacteraeota bacterium]
MPLTDDEVAHVAMLARLGLTEEERARLAVELGAIIDHVSALERVDTSAVAETAHIGGMVNVWREDVERPPIDRAAALANAPDQDGSCFRVGAIQEER